jgi:hypothetical protein
MSTHQKIFMGLYVFVFTLVPIGFYIWLDFSHMSPDHSSLEGYYVSIMAHYGFYPFLSGLGAWFLYYCFKTSYIPGRTGWSLFVSSFAVIVFVVWKVYLFFFYSFEFYGLEQDNLYPIFYTTEFLVSFFAIFSDSVWKTR